MPSRAYFTLKNNLKQVDRLLDAFVEMRTPIRGRKHLDHFTRAALVFLCSSWEVYIEQISNDSGEIIAKKLSTPDELPDTVKKQFLKLLKIQSMNYHK